MPINAVCINSGILVEGFRADDLQLAPGDRIKRTPIRRRDQVVSARDHKPVLLVQVQQKLTPTCGEVAAVGFPLEKVTLNLGPGAAAMFEIWEKIKNARVF